MGLDVLITCCRQFATLSEALEFKHWSGINIKTYSARDNLRAYGKKRSTAKQIKVAIRLDIDSFSISYNKALNNSCPLPFQVTT